MNCVELFAGAGGAALGLEEAGVEHLALVEWDKDACATMRAAGLGPVIEGDVRDLHAIESVLGITEEQAWNRAGNMLLDDPREGDDWMMAREALASQLLDPDLDLLWSSFPCQGWSSAGARLGARDPRNGWPWTVAAIDRLQPRWFLGENVRGLTMHSGCASELDCPGCYLRGVIVPQLKERFPFAGYWVLDAADYGVPQHRRRVILWAGPAPLQAPAPTHGPPGQGDLFRRLEPYATPDWWDRPAPTVTAQEVKGTRASEASGGTFNGGPDRASDALYLATGRRRLTVEECAALQSFPPDHPWRGTKRSKYMQVGNAVPPPLARVVAQRVLEADASLT